LPCWHGSQEAGQRNQLSLWPEPSYVLHGEDHYSDNYTSHDGDIYTRHYGDIHARHYGDIYTRHDGDNNTGAELWDLCMWPSRLHRECFRGLCKEQVHCRPMLYQVTLRNSYTSEGAKC